MSTVNLRDRVFSDTGGVVQGATVQAILVTGGGTDAGTSSVVQSTTTTDVNGVWKFTALPDPGAGNWYDVKIINGNQVRWRYGNIQSALSQLLVSNTSFSVPALGIGVAAPSSGLQVQSGNVGIGAAPSANAALLLQGAAVNKIYMPNSGGVSTGLMTLSYGSVATGGGSVAAFAGFSTSTGSNFQGLLLISPLGSLGCGAYWLNGSNNSTNLLFSSGLTYGTANGASNVNVYWNATQYVLQNTGGGTQAFAGIWLPVVTNL